MLAVNRTAKVRGRIFLLIISMKTIKGCKTAGVPDGTKRARSYTGCKLNLIRLWPSQTGKANAAPNTKWVEEVNT